MASYLNIFRRALSAVVTILAAGALVAAAAVAAAAAQPTVVVADGTGNQITSYALGSGTPIRQIAGTATGLSDATEVAADRSGNLYVANATGVRVTVYAANATGNVTPIRTISGSSTGLRSPFGVAVDGTGRLYVSNTTGDTITEYAAGANGNVAPVARIGGSATGLAAPRGLALDHAGQLWVLNSDGTVREFTAAASGNAAPITTLSAVRLDFATHIAFDSAGHLFVSGGQGSTSLVEEFAAGATGGDAPIATLGGVHTGLGSVAGLAILPGVEQLLVADTRAHTVNEYRTPADGDTPPLANALPGATLANPTGLLAQAPPTVLAPGTLSGMVGARFSATLTAGGGFGPYAWSLASGVLPAGLALSAAGTISGTPTSTGTTTFSVTVTDQSLPALWRRRRACRSRSSLRFSPRCTSPTAMER